MNLHEFQAKHLFTEVGIPVPAGILVNSSEQADEALKALAGERWVVKAQIHAGARGKAGGVKITDNKRDVSAAVSDFLGKNLVTVQTDAQGLPVNAVLIEEVTPFIQEFYLSMVVDRTAQRLRLIASASGGMEIEAVAETTPEMIHGFLIDPSVGIQDYQIREIGFDLGLELRLFKPLGQIIRKLYTLFNDVDASQIEINPLVLTEDGHFIALDAKINLDDNALFMHPELLGLRDASQEDEKEYLAQQNGLNYISLDGNIGCMVNGAGLAMATMDLVKLYGGKPANFLDVGGGATAERVAEAFKIILSDGQVKAILVNIFGGIVRCDTIAEGIVAAIREVRVNVPVVVRLEGTQSEQGREVLAKSGLAVIPAEDLARAAQRVVEAAV